MCEECEQADGLAAVYVRKANRYGWRPPAASTVPGCGPQRALQAPADDARFGCVAAPADMQTKVN